MPDRLSPSQRSYNMSRIHGKDTKPEMLVRRYLWNQGYRYRLHSAKLPGKPDIVLRKYKVCIFINGCFWHGHEGCRYYTVPKSNTEFWVGKVTRNRERDAQVLQKLEAMGWHCITLWECSLKPRQREATLRALLDTLSRFYFQDHGIRLYEVCEEDVRLRVADVSADVYKSS